jgi:beta-mannosidase
MVWQDFALACALYPQTAAFHDKIRREAEAIVPLFRNHPSLALWAGNNEIDQFYPWAKPGIDPNEDDRISRVVLPEVCRRLDPLREYLPSSPFYSPAVMQGGFKERSAPEDHLWGPRDDFKGKFYTGARALFASEIGYHGCPARSSLERMMRPEHLWPWQDNEDWLTHAVRPQPDSTRYNYRIPLMASQIGVLFERVPDTLDEFVLGSQISQAEALKFFIEMFRIRKGKRTGLLWWNIRDGWPQISDAIVDYYGAKKLAYHVVRRLQENVLVMLGEPEDGAQDVVAVNDTLHPVTLDSVEVSRGKDILFSARGVTIPVNGRTLVARIPAQERFAALDIAWEVGGKAGRNHYLAGPRPFSLERVAAFYRATLGDEPVAQQTRPLAGGRKP